MAKAKKQTTDSGITFDDAAQALADAERICYGYEQTLRARTGNSGDFYADYNIPNSAGFSARYQLRKLRAAEARLRAMERMTRPELPPTETKGS